MNTFILWASAVYGHWTDVTLDNWHTHGEDQCPRTHGGACLQTPTQ
jgi:hypothetical protein